MKHPQSLTVQVELEFSTCSIAPDAWTRVVQTMFHQQQRQPSPRGEAMPCDPPQQRRYLEAFRFRLQETVVGKRGDTWETSKRIAANSLVRKTMREKMQT